MKRLSVVTFAILFALGMLGFAPPNAGYKARAKVIEVKGGVITVELLDNAMLGMPQTDVEISYVTETMEFLIGKYRIITAFASQPPSYVLQVLTSNMPVSLGQQVLISNAYVYTGVSDDTRVGSGEGESIELLGVKASGGPAAIVNNTQPVQAPQMQMFPPPVVDPSPATGPIGEVVEVGTADVKIKLDVDRNKVGIPAVGSKISLRYITGKGMEIEVATCQVTSVNGDEVSATLAAGGPPPRKGLKAFLA